MTKHPNEGKLPKSWKRVEVRPIFKKKERKKEKEKKGEINNASNYRPVILTSVVFKVFGGFVRDALNNHFSDNKLLVDQQYGFMSGGSCITQLLTNINENLGGIKASGCCLSGSTKGI